MSFKMLGFLKKEAVELRFKARAVPSGMGLRPTVHTETVANPS